MGEPTEADNIFFGLTGKKMVVTGAGRGIGKGVALGLARAGADGLSTFPRRPDQSP